MKIWVDIVNGTIVDAEKKAHELREETGHLYSIIKYNDLADCIENGIKFRLDCMAQRGELNNKDMDAEIDKAYKQGWEDCKKYMLKKIQGGDTDVT